MVRPSTALLIALPLLLAACDETDAVAVRIRLRDDLSGTVRTSSLVLPAADGPVQKASDGATWGTRAEMACATGTFVDISKLRIVDIAFGAGEGGQGIGFAKVVLPRGPDVRWPKNFVPMAEDERKGVAAALDPSGKSESVGTTLKLEIELPSAVIGNGVVGKTRGTKVTADGSVATLVVPLDAMTTPGDPITWHLTWQK
jgi:hypothetical protein